MIGDPEVIPKHIATVLLCLILLTVTWSLSITYGQDIWPQTDGGAECLGGQFWVISEADWRTCVEALIIYVT